MALSIGQFIGKLLGRGASAARRDAARGISQAARSVLGRTGTRPLTPLTHYTSEAAQKSILNPTTGVLRGSGGIFAIPTAAGEKMSPLMRSIATGVKPSNLTHAVPIPQSALPNFERVLPIGPYSLWKRIGGVRMAAPGEINPFTGAYKQTGSIWKTRAQMYGPDAIMIGGAAAAPTAFNALTNRE